MSKKKFYAEYDALFNNKAKNSPKKKAPTKKKEEVAKKHFSINKKTVAWISVILVIFGIKFYQRTIAPILHVFDYDYGEVDDEDDYDDDEDYIDAGDELGEIYPLKEEGIKNDPNRDLKEPLHVGLEDKNFTFSPNYQMQVKGDADIVFSRDELSLLPTNEEYPDTKHVATIQVYNGKRRGTEIDLSMSRNLIDSTTVYTHGNDVTYTKAYPQKEMEKVKDGYIYSYEDDDEDYATIKLYRYFIFPNGTGVLLKIYSDSDEIKDVSAGVTFEEVKKWYPQEMKVLEESFQMKKEDK